MTNAEKAVARKEARNKARKDAVDKVVAAREKPKPIKKRRSARKATKKA